MNSSNISLSSDENSLSENELEKIRHSAAHVLACAVQKLYPSAKIAIGPTIQNGFYYDFLIPDKTLSIADLEVIELEMKKIIKEGYFIKRIEITDPEKQIKEFLAQGEKFKAELLEKYKDESPSMYGFFDRQNNLIWSDFCKGPHASNTSKIKAFKLLSVSSSYWHGDENLDSLQRVYGTAWQSKEALEEHLKNLEEADRRDHRKLSKQHKLFSTREESGPGLIMWHPKLAFLRSRVEDFWKKIHEDNGYELVYTPHIARSELWNISGHTQFYSENMFSLKPIDEQEYILKPMNCPFHMLIYNSVPHSYKEFPIKLAEMGTVYRFERSGVMHGLARVRGFTQDDAHVFCTPAQLISEVESIISLIDKIYSKFGLSYSAELSTRPPEKIGTEEVWDMSENALKEALKLHGLKYELNEGDGAFYGPKIDFKLKDAIGRSWQGATIQVDFNLPERFDLKFTNSEGKEERPVMLHRAIFGSLERFTALLIEHYAGAFPLWLCQTQVLLLPIADRHNEYCQNISEKLIAEGFKVKIDSRAEKIGAKIRDAQLEQVPYMIIVGDKELETQTLSVRERRKGDLGSIGIDELVKDLKAEMN